MEEKDIKEYQNFFDDLLKTNQFKDFILTNNIIYDEGQKVITLFKEDYHITFCRNKNIYTLFTEGFEDFHYNNINDFMEKLEKLLNENNFNKIKNEKLKFLKEDFEKILKEQEQEFEEYFSGEETIRLLNCKEFYKDWRIKSKLKELIEKEEVIVIQDFLKEIIKLMET